MCIYVLLSEVDKCRCVIYLDLRSIECKVKVKVCCLIRQPVANGLKTDSEDALCRLYRSSICSRNELGVILIALYVRTSVLEIGVRKFYWSGRFQQCTKFT